MKPSKIELLRKIDAIKGVGEQSKPGIRDLVAEITGIDLTPEPTYRRGQRVQFGICDYILASSGDNTITAVNLESGDRRGPGVRVRNYYHITHSELVAIFHTKYPHKIKPR